MEIVTDKNKELSAAAAASAGSGNFGGGVTGVQVIGADPINALQHLTKQPVPAGMVQPGGSMFTDE